MYVSRTITIEHKVHTKDELAAFNEYINSLVTTLDHTPYGVNVEHVFDNEEELE